jgi:biotin carboxyl carrier protein
MDIKRIEALIEVIKDAQVTELAIRGDGSAVVVRKLPRVNGFAAVALQAAPEQTSSPQSEDPAEREAQAGTIISAPMVGIFHVMDGIKGPGAQVKKGQVVGAIESMKLMNEVVSQVDGTVEEIHVEDGTPVEYGQVLFRLNSA